MSGYIMEDPREAARLADKVDDAGAWVERYFAESLQTASTMLCVGCGSGLFLDTIARRYPSLDVTGVDLGPDRVDAARQRIADLSNARAVVGNALALPFERSAFDVVLCRLMLEYIAEPQQAIAQMTRVARPGGRVILQDLDGQLVWHYPPDPVLEEAIDAVLEALAATGFDPYVGRKLFWHARAAGLQDITVRVDSYHLYAGTIDDRGADLWRRKLAIAHPRLEGALGVGAARSTADRFIEYLQRPDTLSYSTMFTINGVVGPHHSSP